MISIPFRFETKYGAYSDTLWFTEEEYAALSEEQIEEMKQQRVANWINLIENPPVFEEVITEE